MNYIGILYGLGYIFFMYFILRKSYPHKSYYNIFNNKIFLVHFIINIIIAAVAFYRCSLGNYKEAFFIAPLLFLIIFWILNQVTKILLKRDVIILTRGDSIPQNYNWFVDTPITILILILPLCTCGYLMNLFHFGKLF